MSMFEQASAAWKVQSAKEQATRIEEERRLRNEFEEQLKEITEECA